VVVVVWQLATRKCRQGHNPPQANHDPTDRPPNLPT
jgi:hypothetical protein